MLDLVTISISISFLDMTCILTYEYAYVSLRSDYSFLDFLRMIGFNGAFSRAITLTYVTQSPDIGRAYLFPSSPKNSDTGTSCSS